MMCGERCHLETQLSQRHPPPECLGMLFHGPSVDVSSTANIQAPILEADCFENHFPIKKKNSILPFAILSQVSESKLCCLLASNYLWS